MPGIMKLGILAFSLIALIPINFFLIVWGMFCAKAAEQK